MDTKGDYESVSDDDDEDLDGGFAIAYSTQHRAPIPPRGDGLFAAFASKPVQHGMHACMPDIVALISCCRSVSGAFI